jgi:hypothetical protein
VRASAALGRLGRQHGVQVERFERIRHSRFPQAPFPAPWAASRSFRASPVTARRCITLTVCCVSAEPLAWPDSPDR